MENNAVKRSVLRTFAFGILSGGLYSFYWFYVTRQAVTAEVKGDDNVGLQTLGLLVPILNIVIAYWLWRDIQKAREQVGLKEGFNAQMYVGIVVAAIVLSWIPIVGALLALAIIVVYGLVIKGLNEYWDKKTAGKAVEAKVTGSEILVVVAGIVLNVLLYMFVFSTILAATALQNSGGTLQINGNGDGTGTYNYSAE